MLKLYADREYIKFFNSYCKKQFKENDKNIKCQCVPNGIIVNEHEHGFGVFDDKYKFVKSSFQAHKGGKGQFVPKFNHDDIEYCDEDAIFLSHIAGCHETFM